MSAMVCTGFNIRFSLGEGKGAPGGAGCGFITLSGVSTYSVGENSHSPDVWEYPAAFPRPLGILSLLEFFSGLTLSLKPT